MVAPGGGQGRGEEAPLEARADASPPPPELAAPPPAGRAYRDRLLVILAAGLFLRFLVLVDLSARDPPFALPYGEVGMVLHCARRISASAGRHAKPASRSPRRASLG